MSAPDERPITSPPEPAAAGEATTAFRPSDVTQTYDSPGPRGRVGRVPEVPGYEVLGELGRGGMGVVYEAVQVALRRRVALKMVLAGSHAEPAELERFKAEAQAVAHLQHPNIVQVHEVGEADGLPYFSLELCTGGSLQSKLRGGPLVPLEAASLVATLARAMHHAHAHGIVHRDLKPANVLLASGGMPKITDFGLAKRLDEVGQTVTGMVMGTPSYMAPEQAGGQARQVGPAADVWALGAILYECLTGRPPFRAATTMDTLLQVLHDEPVPPTQLQPGTPRDLETICLKCLEKAPERRYVSALALAEDLRRYQAGEPVLAKPVGPLGRLVKWARRKPAIAGLLSTIVLVVAVAFGLVLWQWREARDQSAAKTEALGRETSARREAEDALEDTRRSLADSRVSQALTAWRGNDAPTALELLDDCPERFRFWDWRYVRRMCSDGEVALFGHTAFVTQVAWRPDGRHLATADGNGTVKVWDACTWDEALTLSVVPHQVADLAYSPDARRLAVACRQAGAKVFDAETGKELLAITPKIGGAWAVAFSPDSGLLAVGGWVGLEGRRAGRPAPLGLYDATTGTLVANLSGPLGGLRGLAFSPDGRSLAGSGEDLTVRVWDIAARSMRYQITVHATRLGRPVYTPDGRHLAAPASRDRQGAIILWHAENGREAMTLPHAGHANGIAFSPDGRSLAVGANVANDLPRVHIPGQRSPELPGDIAIWDLRIREPVLSVTLSARFIYGLCYAPDGRRLAGGLGHLDSQGTPGEVAVWDARHVPQSRPLTGHSGEVQLLVFSPDGQRTVSGASDPFLRIHDARSGQELYALPGRALGAAFNPDGRLLATASADGTVRLWDGDREVRALAGAGVRVAFTSEGNLVSAGGDPVSLKYWDHATGRLLRTVAAAPIPPDTRPGKRRELLLSPDGRSLATVGWDGQMQVLDAEDGQERRSWTAHKGAVIGAAFNPKGDRLATAGADGFVKVWDLTSGRELFALRGHAGIVRAVAFSADGQRLVSSGGTAQGQGELRIWDAHNGQEVLVLSGLLVDARAVAFSPDGTHLAAGAGTKGQGELSIWDARPLPPVLSLAGHEEDVYCVAYSSDGQRLATGGRDKTARLWDVRTGRLLQVFRGHTQWVWCVDISPDGARLATATFEFSKPTFEVRIWDARDGHAVLSLPDQTTSVEGLAWTRDGQVLVAHLRGGGRKAWDTTTGAEVPAPEIKVALLSRTATSPDRSEAAFATRSTVRVVQLRADAQERAWRQAWAQTDLGWHAREAAQAEKDKAWLATSFHLDFVAKSRPDDPSLRSRRAWALAKQGRWGEAAVDFTHAAKVLLGSPAHGH